MGKTIAEKIFDSHRVDEPFADTWVLKLDRVFCHEITTPVAISDLQSKGKDKVFDATKIKAVIDHVTPAKDSKTALQGKILRDWARKNQILGDRARLSRFRNRRIRGKAGRAFRNIRQVLRALADADNGPDS